MVLDASCIGEGSPGRNSGFMLEIALADDADPDALARMGRCNALIRETMETLRDQVNVKGIPCQLARTGTFRGAATETGVRYLKRYRAFLRGAGLEYQELDSAALERRIGTAYYRYGLYSPDCSLVQPAALIRGLADDLPTNVQLFEQTPVLSVTREPTAWRVVSAQASIVAPRVILANNAFARELGAGLRSRLGVMYTYAGLTPPLPDAALGALDAQEEAPEWGLLPAHRLGTTLRRTTDGRFMVRSYYGYEREEDNARVATRLRDCLVRRFPQLELDTLAPFEHVWGGATGFTYNGAPVWGQARPGLWVSAGCNGGGVVKGTLFGTLLARRAMGEDVPDVADLFGRASWMPPEPLRRLGFTLIAMRERRSAGRET